MTLPSTPLLVGRSGVLVIDIKGMLLGIPSLRYLNGQQAIPDSRLQSFVLASEDKVGLDAARECGLVGNFLWANDYPHHEGTWPHSGPAIERTMGALSDGERARILGLNSAELFKFPVPKRYLDHADAAAAAAHSR